MTKTLETLPRNNQAALSTPASLDIVALVKQVASRKAQGAKDGHSFVAKKGKTDLFSGVWAAYRSARGIPKFDENLKPTLASVTEAAEINQAIADFWRLNAEEFLTFGEQHSSRKGGIAGKVNDDGTTQTWQSWRMERRKKATDNKEKHFFNVTMLERAKKRMDSMLDGGKYDRDQLAEQSKVVIAWETARNESAKLVKE